MKAIIIYDDIACATKAKAILQRAANRADRRLRWVVKAWHFDSLNLPSAVKTSMTEAIDTHLILVALSQPFSFPASLQIWLESWAQHRHVQEAALAVWTCGQGDSLSAKIPPELKEFAARHGLSCMFGEADATATERTAFSRCSQECARCVIRHPRRRRAFRNDCADENWKSAGRLSPVKRRVTNRFDYWIR